MFSLLFICSLIIFMTSFNIILLLSSFSLPKLYCLDNNPNVSNIPVSVFLYLIFQGIVYSSSLSLTSKTIEKLFIVLPGKYTFLLL